MKSRLDNINQTINALPHDNDQQKQVFNQLVKQLKVELEKISLAYVKEAEKLVKRIKTLTVELDEEEPDKEMVEITGKSLKKAA